MFRVSLIALLSLVSPAISQAIPENVAALEVDTGWRQADGTHVMGMTIRLAPGWKTYWRAPGDGGIPPRFNWSGSKNLTSAAVHFPVPKVMDQNGIRSIGYEDQVTLPIHVSLADPTKPAEVRGEVEIGICEEVCIPYVLSFRAQLPTKGTASDTLRAAMADRPEPGGAMTCKIRPIDDGLSLVASTGMTTGSNPVAVIEVGEKGVWVSEPVLSRAAGTLHAEVEMVPPTAKPFALSRSDVRMTVFTGGRAIEMRGCS